MGGSPADEEQQPLVVGGKPADIEIGGGGGKGDAAGSSSLQQFVAQNKIPLIIFYYGFCSSTLIVINKVAVHNLTVSTRSCWGESRWDASLVSRTGMVLAGAPGSPAAHAGALAVCLTGRCHQSTTSACAATLDGPA